MPAPSLKVQQFGCTVFVTDTTLGDPLVGMTVYSHKFHSIHTARKLSDLLCQEIASGLPRDKLCIAEDIEQHLAALRYLPPSWR